MLSENHISASPTMDTDSQLIWVQLTFEGEELLRLHWELKGASKKTPSPTGCGILYWQERSQAAGLLRQLTLVLAAPSYNTYIQTILRKSLWKTGHWRCLCAQLCPEYCPHIAKLASDFWGPAAKCGWVVRAQKNIPVGSAGWKSCTCSHRETILLSAPGTSPCKALPSPPQKSCHLPTYPKDTLFFQNWWVFPQHLPTNKFSKSRVN